MATNYTTSAMIPNAGGIRPVFANSTFNIYAHMDPESRSIMAPQATLNNLMQYRMVDPLQYMQTMKQPRFVQAYNRLIFQNPRIQNIQHLVVPSYGYPASIQPIYSNVRNPIEQIANMNQIKNMESSQQHPLRIRHLRDISELHEDSTTSGHWESESSISERSLLIPPKEHTNLSDGRIFTTVNLPTGKKADHINDSTTHGEGENEQNQDDVGESNSATSKKISKSAGEKSMEESKGYKDSSQRQKSPASKPKGSQNTSYTLGNRKNNLKLYADQRNFHSERRPRNKKESSRIYRVHDRPLYERYQEAFKDSVRRGEYWRKKANRQLKLSESAKVQMFPHQQNYRYTQMPSDYFPMPVETNMYVRPEMQYNFANQQFMDMQGQSSNFPNNFPTFNTFTATNEMIKLQRKLHHLRLQVKTMKKEISTAKPREMPNGNDEDIKSNKKYNENDATTASLSATANNNEDIKQDCETSNHSNVVRHGRSERSESDPHKVKNKRLQTDEKKPNQMFTYQMMYKHGNRSSNIPDTTSYRYIRNRIEPSYKWENAPPPPMINQPSGCFLNYEAPIQACSTYCALHDSSDSDETTDASSNKLAFSAIENCTSPRILYQHKYNGRHGLRSSRNQVGVHPHTERNAFTKPQNKVAKDTPIRM